MFLIVFPYFSFGGLPQLLVQICKILSESDPVLAPLGVLSRWNGKNGEVGHPAFLEEL